MAETITARDANQHFSRRLREVAEGKSFVITHHGRSVARLVLEPASDSRRLTPEQEQALEESIACALPLERPAAPPEDLPPDWPRDRDDLYDEVLRERSGKRWSHRPLVAFDGNVLVCTAQAGAPPAGRRAGVAPHGRSRPLRAHRAGVRGVPLRG